MIGDKVFVYIDDCGHCHVFPCENREDLINIYETAANHVIEYLEGRKKLFEKDNSVTQEDIDACTSDRAKQLLKVELRKQQKLSVREDEEIKLIRGYIAAIKEGDEYAEEDFIENMDGHEIRLCSGHGDIGKCTIQEPNF
jgi:hypothetical protein